MAGSPNLRHAVGEITETVSWFGVRGVESFAVILDEEFQVSSLDGEFHRGVAMSRVFENVVQSFFYGE